MVIQTDFGEKDGAVAAMRGVAYSIDRSLTVEDLTHEIPAFDVWQAAYRLGQTAPFWPPGTVFVSVVDPGVGTDRKSVVAKANNQYFVTPDNGTLSVIAEVLGIDAVREIDENVNRRPGSENSHTFHGRDVYAYTGARLAAGIIDFDHVGPSRPVDSVVVIKRTPAERIGGEVRGFIPVLDPQYGNVWTNIPQALFESGDIAEGRRLKVRILHSNEVIWQGTAPYKRTFGDVAEGAALVYINSLGNVAIALNQGNFADAHHIESGPEWTVSLTAID